MKTLAEFIQKHHITMSVERADTNPNYVADDDWMRSARHFKCTLRCGKRRMTLHFSQGCAHTKEPTVEDVLNCLASDSAGLDNSTTFESWCAEYGYDTDSRKAEKIYRACQKQRDQLERLIGDATEFETLLYNTERM